MNDDEQIIQQDEKMQNGSEQDQNLFNNDYIQS